MGAFLGGRLAGVAWCSVTGGVVVVNNGLARSELWEATTAPPASTHT